MATHSSVLAWGNPRDRGAWWAAIYEVTQSQTQLKWLSSSSRTTFGNTEHPIHGGQGKLYCCLWWVPSSYLSPQESHPLGPLEEQSEASITSNRWLQTKQDFRMSSTSRRIWMNKWPNSFLSCLLPSPESIKILWTEGRERQRNRKTIRLQVSLDHTYLKPPLPVPLRTCHLWLENGPLVNP